mmetsp:Transcript_24228/g.53790  ORF Transcript_24228/g.53790 Transcript_24228/m.53790 type:complete len:393 (-) Transcript_24228:128-1306(-)
MIRRRDLPAVNLPDASHQQGARIASLQDSLFENGPEDIMTLRAQGCLRVGVDAAVLNKGANVPLRGKAALLHELPDPRLEKGARIPAHQNALVQDGTDHPGALRTECCLRILVDAALLDEGLEVDQIVRVDGWPGRPGVIGDLPESGHENCTRVSPSHRPPFQDGNDHFVRLCTQSLSGGFVDAALLDENLEVPCQAPRRRPCRWKVPLRLADEGHDDGARVAALDGAVLQHVPHDIFALRQQGLLRDFIEIVSVEELLQAAVGRGRLGTAVLPHFSPGVADRGHEQSAGVPALREWPASQGARRHSRVLRPQGLSCGLVHLGVLREEGLDISKLFGLSRAGLPDHLHQKGAGVAFARTDAGVQDAADHIVALLAQGFGSGVVDAGVHHEDV